MRSLDSGSEVDKIINEVIDAIAKITGYEDTEAIKLYERHVQYVADCINDDCLPSSIAEGVCEREWPTQEEWT